MPNDADCQGFLLVDKPAGMTSHDVVGIVRRAFKTRRVGHAGTLDPFATGLLVVLVGRGTRLIPYVDGDPKVYEATICFGAETETDDLTGGVVRRSTHLPTDVELAEAVARLTGEIEQLPPAYSAKQIDGVRAYDAARRGTPLDLRPVRVRVDEWLIVGREENAFRVRITCGGGTYIRSLARDLGRLCGSAAHLSALRRVRSGEFTVDDAHSLEAVGDGRAALRPLLDAVPSLVVRSLAEAELARALHGGSIPCAGSSDDRGAAPVALVDDKQTLIAIAVRQGDALQPKLVLRDA